MRELKPEGWPFMPISPLGGEGPGPVNTGFFRPIKPMDGGSGPGPGNPT